MKTSALMSVYQGTSGQELEDTLCSIANQTFQATELVTVLDGPVSNEVREILHKFVDKLAIRFLELSSNQGLGVALSKGLEFCSYDWIFRIDSDDIYPPNRFESQIQFIRLHPDIVVLGGQLAEHYSHLDQSEIHLRQVPTTLEEIRHFANWRNPVNHQTVLLNKQIVTAVGGYQNMPFFEDFHLWLRVLDAGYRIANLEETLAETSLSDEYFQRRGGRAYFAHEKHFAQSLVNLNIFSLPHFYAFLATRLAFRVVSVRQRERFYRFLLR